MISSVRLIVSSFTLLIRIIRTGVLPGCTPRLQVTFSCYAFPLLTGVLTAL